jgi:nicotinamidase-related amidase
MLESKNTILVIIDVQGKLAQIMHDREDLIKNLQILISGAKLLEIPIIWMEQLPDKLGPTIPEIQELLPDMEPIVKDVFSCGKNEEFNGRLQELHVHDIILAGIESHVCVYQTAMDLLDQDYAVHVAADAVSSRTDSNKQLGLERMLLEGVVQTSVEMVLFELQGVATGDRFRELAKLVK